MEYFPNAFRDKRRPWPGAGQRVCEETTEKQYFDGFTRTCFPVDYPREQYLERGRENRITAVGRSPKTELTAQKRDTYIISPLFGGNMLCGNTFQRHFVTNGNHGQGQENEFTKKPRKSNISFVLKLNWDLCSRPPIQIHF